MLASIHNLAKFRKGMTLVELLIAMSIMVMMAAITAAFYPSISSDNQISNTANKIQSTLVGARQVAMRTRQVTGVRFLADGNNPANSISCTQMVLIQKPSDLTGLAISGSFTLSNGHLILQDLTKTVTKEAVNLWDMTTGLDMVLPGDIVMNPTTNRSTNVIDRGWSNPANVNGLGFLNLTTNQVVQVNTVFYNPTDISGLNYKIIRQPRVVPGEEPALLPDGYEIPLLALDASSMPVKAKNMIHGPAWREPLVNDYSIDVSFDKTGSLYQMNYSSNVYIWLTKTGSSKPEDGAVIGVNRMNGKVGVFPVGPVDLNNLNNSTLHDPFRFAKDPSNEGL